MTKKQQKLLLGAHISIAGGAYKAFARAESIGCTTMQIFSKSNRQWHTKPLGKEEIEAFKNASKESTVKPIIVHASYLINIAAPSHATLEKSITALTHELERCEQLGIPFLVLHPGSRLDSDKQSALERVASSLDECLEAIDGRVMILLELMAGQGSSVCATFEDLAQVIELSKHKHRIGICFDTCHAYAAGYDFSTPKTYEAMWKEFDTTIGIHKLKAIHMNDSKKELGSRVDRHEEIGRGKIGLEGFRLLMNDEALFDVPKILETPKDTLPDYEHNIKLLKSLLTQENRKRLEVED